MVVAFRGTLRTVSGGMGIFASWPEDAGDVGVKHVPTAGSVGFGHTLECHVAGESRVEAVRIVVKKRSERWVAQSAKYFLCHAVTHGRRTRRPRATDTFGDHHTPNGSWLVDSSSMAPTTSVIANSGSANISVRNVTNCGSAGSSLAVMTNQSWDSEVAILP